MSDRLEQCKEVVEVMKRKETNMGMVEDNLGQVVNNLEEAWGNLVEEYFNVPALQVNCPNPKPLKTHLHTEDTPSRYLHHHHPHCQHHHNLWYCVQGRRPPHQPALLACGPTTASQTTTINERFSFCFSRWDLSILRFENEIISKSLSLRQKQDFCKFILLVMGERWWYLYPLVNPIPSQWVVSFSLSLFTISWDRSVTDYENEIMCIGRSSASSATTMI